jgi:ribbon-helix-helix CopG family protein
MGKYYESPLCQRVTATISEKQFDDLTKLARQRRESLAALLRHIISQFLEHSIDANSDIGTNTE